MKPTLIRPAPPRAAQGAVATPIMPSVVYAADDPDALDAIYEGRAQGHTYSREGHPNAAALARAIDAMEHATGGLVTGSGMAAVTAVLLGLCTSGDHVIGGDALYGRSLRMMADDLPRLGIATTLVDTGDVDAVRAAIRPETRMILCEIVSNPTLRLADLDGLAELAQQTGVLLVVDNTFTTPRAVQPLRRGADIVLHSVTKLLSGHSDAMLGYVAARNPELQRQIYDFATTTGLTPSPFDCWLAERGLATFHLRFERAQDTARILADHLAAQPGVTRVLYPTRPDHPDHNRAQALLDGQGCNMVSFVIPGGRAQTNAFARAADGIAFAPTLGDVGTTLSHPASSSHRSLSAERRAELGMPEGFFRVSVGLEDPEALTGIFDRALTAATAD